ncbi:MFS transporter [Massilia sp. CCM 8733]|uniref:MFS transporter n=1 Tax=Massilia mucilaginosa TaxID=2609282 RepID=A0ABX0P1C2_9BURK|nr:MFS transporter [Massilia mucilaginosa]NHZ93010.1 MFS transporter [Massilia mucilaginosa]
MTQPSPIPASAVPLLSLAAFGSGISMRAADPLLPLLSREFGVPLGDASLVITVFSIAYGVAQLGFGPLGDRYGKYLVIALAALASSATALLCAAATSLPALLAVRLLAGATAAAIIPLSMAWIGDVIDYEQRQPVLARFLIGQILGVSAGVLVGGFAADAHQWRLPFLLVAAIFLLVGLGLLALNRRLPPHANSVRPIAGGAVRHMLAEFRHIAALPWARLVLLTAFLEGGLLYGPFAFIASHLHQRHGISLAVAGAVIMLFGFGGFAFAMGSKAMLARLGEGGLARSGGVLLAVSLAAVGLAPVWWLAMPASFCAGLGFYMLHNTLQTNATQMAPERRGAAVSAFASCFFMGQAMGVGLAGLLLAHAGTAALLAGGALGLLAVALNFSRRVRRR